MDRTKSMSAVIMVLIIIVGVFTFSIISYNKSRGIVKLTSPQEDITVYVDGKKKGQIPINVDKIDLGLRTFTFKKEGYEDNRILIDLKPKSNFEKIIYLSNQELPVKKLFTSQERMIVPALYHDDLLVSTIEGQLINLSPSGDKKWSNKVNGIILDKPLVYKNYLVVDTLDGPFSVFNINSGKLLWSKSGISGGDIAPLTIHDNKIWVLSKGDTRLSAYNFDGQLLKEINLDTTIVSDSFKVDDNHLAFVTTGGDFYRIKDSEQQVVPLSNLKTIKTATIIDDKIYTLYRDGDFRLFSDKGDLIHSKTRTELYNSFYIDKYLYMIRKDKFEICNLETGKTITTRELQENINYFNIIDDRLWIGGEQRFLYIFDKDGNFIAARNMTSTVRGVSRLPDSNYTLITTEDNLFLLALNKEI